MEETFTEYLTQARVDFVKEVNEQEWDTKLRTSAESFLIAYDQLAARYEKLQEVLGFKDEIFNKS